MMANIRFVKPANDNRIRSVPDDLMLDNITNMTSSAETEVTGIKASKINDIKHITTPKRKVNNINTTDIFITNRIDSRSQNMSTFPRIDQACNISRCKKIDNISETSDNFEILRKQPLQKCSSKFTANANQCNCQKCLNSNWNSVPSSDKDQNSNVPSKPEKNDNYFDSLYEHNSEKSCADDRVNKKIINIAHVSEKAADCKVQTRAKLSRWPTESPREKDESRCPVMKSYSTFGTISDSEISEVLDEELDQLPDIGMPGIATSPSGCQKTQQQQQQHHEQQLQNQEVQKQQPSSAPSSSQEQPYRKHTYSLDNSAGCRLGKNSRPIHRSISDAALIDGIQIPSFFRSINDAKYYGLDKEEPYDIDDMTVNLEETHISTKITGRRDISESTKTAWDTGSNNQVATIATFGRSKDKEINDSSGKSPKSKSGEGHPMMFRSLSGDSVITDRLRSRRCALADPENMIMRQDVREKIEKEVERRRSSMTRKISQFFNVHLGLNREEDLI